MSDKLRYVDLLTSSPVSNYLIFEHCYDDKTIYVFGVSRLKVALEFRKSWMLEGSRGTIFKLSVWPRRKS